jgi:transaldolase
MKLFIDSANLGDIEEALGEGLACGITTNPSLLAKEPKANYLGHMKKIVDIARAHGGTASLSIEVFSDEPSEMLTQAAEFVKELNYEPLAIKIHISHKGKNNLGIIKNLAKKGIRVNCTACMTPLQLAMAAAAGATYISLFYNRLRDSGTEEKFAAPRETLLKEKAVEQSDFNPDTVLRETRDLIANYPRAEIIAGSIRSVTDVKRASLAGAHIVTASLKVLRQALLHYKTDESVEGFFKDFAAWLK